MRWGVGMIDIKGEKTKKYREFDVCANYRHQLREANRTNQKQSRSSGWRNTDVAAEHKKVNEPFCTSDLILLFQST